MKPLNFILPIHTHCFCLGELPMNVKIYYDKYYDAWMLKFFSVVWWHIAIKLTFSASSGGSFVSVSLILLTWIWRKESEIFMELGIVWSEFVDFLSFDSSPRFSKLEFESIIFLISKIRFIDISGSSCWHSQCSFLVSGLTLWSSWQYLLQFLQTFTLQSRHK